VVDNIKGVTEEIISILTGPTPKREIKFRQADYKKQPGTKVQMLAYVDARYVMDRLDATIGNQNWWTEYFCIKDIMFCKLTLRFPDEVIVSKMDCGSESDFEPEKAVVSDALKRAAVLFGIGRDLYSMPKFWAEVPASGYVSKKWKPESWDISPDPQLQSGEVNHSQGKPPLTQDGPEAPKEEQTLQEYAEQVAQKSIKHRSGPEPVYQEPEQPTREAKPVSPAPIQAGDEVLAIPGMHIYHMTEKSFLIGPPGLSTDPSNNTGKSWAAKKLVLNPDKDTFQSGTIQTFHLPTWLVDQNQNLLKPPPKEDSSLQPEEEDLPF